MTYFKTKEELNNFFEKDYYESINYTDYSQREEKYKKTAFDIIHFLNIQPKDNILDYGCAVGHLMKGFIYYNTPNVYGFDISKWALNEASKNNLSASSDYSILNDKEYKLTVILDVLEHMFDDDITTVLNNLNSEFLIVRIPVKLNGDNDFYLEVSRKDPSHINCKTEEEWILCIEKHGFKFSQKIETNTIYDSPGCFCACFKK